MLLPRIPFAGDIWNRGLWRDLNLFGYGCREFSARRRAAFKSGHLQNTKNSPTCAIYNKSNTKHFDYKVLEKKLLNQYTILCATLISVAVVLCTFSKLSFSVAGFHCPRPRLRVLLADIGVYQQGGVQSSHNAV